ncbi:NAD(P)-binding domain-containing protein (plasmid) [Rhizobium lusitanum]|uniref:NADPH-dependent F420 reductase n=1 Tax=Rhizobium lusitanum TaxID=293958 RepID=UPI00161C4B95|nr:NAD(P)-binding domain-containing protein [Rhizobium lusitanum]QND44335.1 NAD(P)-binding domain-containing protein [Rhizobium lusitanum]
MRIGILGAGPVGEALARLAVEQGHEVKIGSRHPARLVDLANAIGCVVGTPDEAAAFGEIVVAAVPLGAIDSLPRVEIGKKIVIDAMNYYPERDGRIASLDARTTTTSELVAARLPEARIVKAFNAILARDLPLGARPPTGPGRRALPIAGDDAASKEVVARLHDQFGFDVVDTGVLVDSWRFERAKPAYCIPLDAGGLQAAVNAATREGELPEGSWRRLPAS